MYTGTGKMKVELLMNLRIGLMSRSLVVEATKHVNTVLTQDIIHKQK